MTYDQAIECDNLTESEVIREIRLHNSNPQEFFEDCGKSEFYSGQTVLDWLGY